MGLGFLGGFLALALLFQLSLSQEPNTNEFFISSFLQSLGPPSLNYNFSSPVCSWQGVECDSLQHVTELRFSGLSLSGVIPENTIGKLDKLESLDLSNNQIAGVSSDFWSLGSTLKSLNLSGNKINGSLSNNLGNFGMLEILDLSCNFYSGSVPLTIGSLSTLQVLNLSANSFEGEIPFATLSCKSLVSMDISSNMLTGTLPEGLGDALPDLAELNLARNKLYGFITEITGMKSLRSLNLSANAFMGSIKGAFQQPKVVLDLSKNKFQGHISRVLLNSSFSWSVLEFLDLSQNQLSGEINLNLNQLAQSLRHLNLAHNRFSHQNFPPLEQLLSLNYLNLSQTNLQGPIPSTISELVSLRTLDLSHNQLNGSVPNLNSLEFEVLDLSMNNLTGEFSLQLLRRLPGMEKYNFSFNNFTLCASNIPSEEFRTTFFGSQDDCPIAVDPGTHMRKKNKEGSKHGNLKLALALTFSILCFALGLLCVALACRRRSSLWAVKHVPYKEEPSTSGPFSFQTDSTTWVADVKSAQSVPVVIFDKPLLNFTFADLLSVTSNFDRGTLLAEGRFGPVYRGCLPGGTHIAVKVLVHGSAMTDQEAAKELEYLGRIKHPNLVPLIGYCLAGEQRIAIYEYMENGNLRNLLHDLPLGVPRVEDWSSDTWEEGGNVGEIVMSSEGLATWAFRHRIALGTARALAFLHHGCFPQIIHRDVKASSVYLGPELEPRLSDFGLSKIFGSDLADQLTRAAPGYTPPELSNGDESETATSKSDVYGFGVVLFELITGKRPFGDEYPDEKDTTLVSWVRRLVRKGQGSRAINPKIVDTGSEEQMVEALRIGFLCTADLPSKRPDMNQVVGLLKDVEPALLHLDG